MGRYEKLLESLLRGDSDANIPFFALRGLLIHLGFNERIRGSHHYFSKPGSPDIINLQPHGHQAKPYQVRQVRRLLWKHRPWLDR